MAPGERLINAALFGSAAFLVWMILRARISAEPDHIQTATDDALSGLTDLTVDLTGFTLGAIAPVVGQLTRGLRNNNPGNIRYGSDQWQGQIRADDAGYIVFDTMQNGVRAMAVILRNYERRYGLNTVSGIVSRWAPSSENDTASYIRDVAGRLNVDPGETIDVYDNVTLSKLIGALIVHENGYNPLAFSEISAGVALA